MSRNRARGSCSWRGLASTAVSCLAAVALGMVLPKSAPAAGLAWDRGDLVGKAFMGGGSATSLPWLVMDSNPAGLAFVQGTWGTGPSLGVAGTRDAIDAFRAYALDNERQWAEYFATGADWTAYSAAHPEFAETITEFAGRRQTLDVRAAIVDVVARDFALSVYGQLTKGYRHQVDQLGAPVPAFAVYHGSGVGLKLGLGRNSGHFLGGEMSMGMALDINLSQEQWSLVTDFDGFSDLVRSDYRKLHYPDLDLALSYSTRLGLQWVGSRDLADAFVPAVGIVLVDPIGSTAGAERPSRLQAGLALRPARKGVPTLSADFGATEVLPGIWDDGPVMGLAEDVGFLRVGLGTGKVGSSAGASLTLGILRCEYLYRSLKDEDLAAVLGEKVHAVRFVLGAFGTTGSVRTAREVGHE